MKKTYVTAYRYRFLHTYPYKDDEYKYIYFIMMQKMKWYEKWLRFFFDKENPFDPTYEEVILIYEE